MPQPTTLLLFTVAAAALVAIPGPNHLYIVTRGVSEGRSAGIASALGIETGTLVHIAAAAAGLSALIASSAVAFQIVKYAGAAYLVYLGIRSLLSKKELSLGDSGTRRQLRRVYRDGVLINVLNPKVALFFLAFLPQFIDPAEGSVATQVVVLGLLLAAIGLISDLVYACVSGALGGWLRRRPGLLRGQRYVAGCTYLALGAAALATDQRRT
ncbi:MAG: LysE family translocator [Propionibacteriales bacterium]|nr:LysE family translocator [Propionibacteriales bacterium]